MISIFCFSKEKRHQIPYFSHIISRPCEKHILSKKAAPKLERGGYEYKVQNFQRKVLTFPGVSFVHHTFQPCPKKGSSLSILEGVI